MGGANYVSLSLATALQRSLDAAANNMANASTAGYKAARPLFESVIANNAANSDTAINFVRDNGSYLDTTQGALMATSSPLDLAISGTGWFSYKTGAGQTAYGRNGRMVVNTNGQLTTTLGHAVLDVDGSPISLPDDIGQDVTIARDGTMTDRSGATLGQIGVFRVPDPNQLRPIGGGLYILPSGSASASATQDSSVMQGFAEQSNVEPAIELTRLIEIQRAYERALKVMSDANDLTKRAVSRIARTV